MANCAEADHAQPPAAYLAPPGQFRPRPITSQHGGRRMVGAPAQHQQACERVFGHPLGVQPRGRKHLDPTLPAGIRVDVVEAGAEPAHGPEATGRFQQGAINPGPVAHDEAPAAGDGGQQVVRPLVKRLVVEHVELPGQVLDRGPVHDFADDHVRHALESFWLIVTPSDRGSARTQHQNVGGIPLQSPTPRAASAAWRRPAAVSPTAS